MTSVSSSQPWGGHCSLLWMFPAPGTSVLPEQCAFSTVVFTAASKFSASFSWFTGSVATQSCAAQLSTAACASVDHGLAVLQSSPITERTAWGLQSISINCQGPKICCRASVNCSASKHVPFFFLLFFLCWLCGGEKAESSFLSFSEEGCSWCSWKSKAKSTS